MVNRTMKDSKVKWIGDIPDNWEVKPLKYIAIIQTGNTPSMKNKHYYSDNGIDWVKTNNLLGTKGVKESEVKLSIEGSKVARIAKAHSTLVSCIGDVGKMGYITLDSAYNQQINAVTFNEDDVFWKYGMYYISVQKEQHQYYQNGNVLKILNTENQKRIVVPVPKIEEQKKIAAFLDEKASHIDNIIENTKKSIENLKAYKQSLITETVTKGLNPNVEMKDSGIEWIGKIPKRWGIEKLKFHSILDPSHKENDNLPEKAQFVPMDNIKDGYLMLSQVRDTDDLVGKYTYFRDGDIVIAKVRPSFENGNIAIASNLENNIGFGTTEIFTLRVVSNKVITEFLFYYLRNSNFLNVASSTMTGVAGLKRISSSFLMNYKIGIPDIEEQSRIVRYLDEKIDKIDSLLRQKEQIVTELDSYKKSLIYEYVTGKKEVK